MTKKSVTMIRGARGENNEQLVPGKTYELNAKLADRLVYSNKAVSGKQKVDVKEPNTGKVDA